MIQDKNSWNYSFQAEFYKFRPNYSESAIDKLLNKIKLLTQNTSIADVGAGTGNLTILLAKRGYKCIAIEPTIEMKKIGQKNTKNMNVKWISGTGENTKLKNKSVDLFAMGSSFNVVDRLATLKEAHRVLIDGGHFCCMWNHRDIEHDEVQKNIEKIIEKIIPDYQRGVRREAQADLILSSRLFNDVYYIQESQMIERNLKQYINAWKSVKNNYWDLNTNKGQLIFNKITDQIFKVFGKEKIFKMTYTTKIWVAKKM